MAKRRTAEIYAKLNLYTLDHLDRVATISGTHRDVVKRVLLASAHARDGADDARSATIEAATGISRMLVLQILCAEVIVSRR